jgi:hypothetical protein
MCTAADDMATHSWINSAPFFKEFMDSYLVRQSVSPVLGIAPMPRRERLGFFDNHSLKLMSAFWSRDSMMIMSIV